MALVSLYPNLWAEKGLPVSSFLARTRGDLPSALAAGFLLIAVSSHWPYFFYVLMRFTVCGSAVYLAHRSLAETRPPWPWILGAVAVLFNPILPVRMHRSDWSSIDVITAFIFLLWLVLSILRNRGSYVD